MPKKKNKTPTEYAIAWRGTQFVGADGIKRNVALGKHPEGKIGLAWATWWNGEDKEPLKTCIVLSMEALNATMALLAELHSRPSSFPPPEPKP